MSNYMFVAQDGSWGSANGMMIVDASSFDGVDYEYFDSLNEGDLPTEIYAMARNRDALAGTPIPVDDDEVPQMIETLEAVIEHLIATGHVGWGAELGDIRDVLNRHKEMADW